jgi:tetratricopeptide (TPR) repeat protein
LWLGLNHQVFGLHPAGWHVASVLLHGVISGLILVLLLRQGYPPWIASIAALFFGLHPVHIESVAWISGVTDPLTCLFLLLLSLLFWLQARETASLLHFAVALSYFFGALLALFSHAYAMAPSNPSAQINLAVVLLEQKQYDRATNLLLSLLARDPNLWSANYNLGLAAYLQSDYATAEKYLRRSIALDPSRPDQFLIWG